MGCLLKSYSRLALELDPVLGKRANYVRDYHRSQQLIYQLLLPCWTQFGRIPSLKADKRKGFIYNRSLSVLTWSICLLTVSEVISAYLRIPITSTLAFGGIGGLAIGLAGKVRPICATPLMDFSRPL